MLTDDEIDTLFEALWQSFDHSQAGFNLVFARAVIAAHEAKRAMPNEPTQAAINAGIQAAQRLAYDALTDNKKFVMADAYTLAIKTAYAIMLKTAESAEKLHVKPQEIV